MANKSEVCRIIESAVANSLKRASSFAEAGNTQNVSPRLKNHDKDVTSPLTNSDVVDYSLEQIKGDGVPVGDVDLSPNPRDDKAQPQTSSDLTLNGLGDGVSDTEAAIDGKTVDPKLQLKKEAAMILNAVQELNKANEALADHFLKSAAYTAEASNESYDTAAGIVKEASADMVDDAVYRAQLVIASLKKAEGLSNEEANAMRAQSLDANGVPPEELAAAQGDAGGEVDQQLVAELEAQFGPEAIEAAQQVLELAAQVGATPEETDAALAEVLGGGGEPVPEDVQVQAEFAQYAKEPGVAELVKKFAEAGISAEEATAALEALAAEDAEQGDAGGGEVDQQLAAELEAQLGPEAVEAAYQVLQLAEQVGATPEETDAALAEVLSGGGEPAAEPVPEDVQVQAEYQSLVDHKIDAATAQEWLEQQNPKSASFIKREGAKTAEQLAREIAVERYLKDICVGTNVRDYN